MSPLLFAICYLQMLFAKQINCPKSDLENEGQGEKRDLHHLTGNIQLPQQNVTHQRETWVLTKGKICKSDFSKKPSIYTLYHYSMHHYHNLIYGIHLRVFCQSSRLYFIGIWRRFSNSNALSTVNSFPAAFRKAFVHRTFRGFLFFLKALWHFARQNRNTCKKIK